MGSDLLFKGPLEPGIVRRNRPGIVKLLSEDLKHFACCSILMSLWKFWKGLLLFS
jgi:hypothetical protein